MAGWGASANNEARPKYLTEDEKETAFATDRGWEWRNPATNKSEVLVAIAGLARKIGGPTIADTYFVSRANVANNDVVVVVNWNTPVNVAANAVMTISNAAVSISLPFAGYLGGTANTNQGYFGATPAGNNTFYGVWITSNTITGVVTGTSGYMNAVSNPSLVLAGDDNATDVRSTYTGVIRYT